MLRLEVSSYEEIRKRRYAVRQAYLAGRAAGVGPTVTLYRYAVALKALRDWKVALTRAENKVKLYERRCRRYRKKVGI